MPQVSFACWWVTRQTPAARSVDSEMPIALKCCRSVAVSGEPSEGEVFIVPAEVVVGHPSNEGGRNALLFEQDLGESLDDATTSHQRLLLARLGLVEPPLRDGEVADQVRDTVALVVVVAGDQAGGPL